MNPRVSCDCDVFEGRADFKTGGREKKKNVYTYMNRMLLSSSCLHISSPATSSVLLLFGWRKARQKKKMDLFWEAKSCVSLRSALELVCYDWEDPSWDI